LSLCYLHLLHIRLLPRSTLFPYTTLFRSLLLHQLAEFFELIEKNKAVDNRHINIKKDQTGKVLGSVFVLPKVIQRSFAGPLHFRSEEHTSELQSRENLVCRLLLEKKKNSI